MTGTTRNPPPRSARGQPAGDRRDPERDQSGRGDAPHHRRRTRDARPAAPGPDPGHHGLVYGSIRGVTRLVGAGVDRALVQLAPLVPEDAPGPRRGGRARRAQRCPRRLSERDRKRARHSMELRQGGRTLEVDRRELRALLPEAGRKLLLLVHGSCMNDRQWLGSATTTAPRSQRDLGYTPDLRPLQQRAARLDQRTRARRAARAAGGRLARPARRAGPHRPQHGRAGRAQRLPRGRGGGPRLAAELRALVCLGSPHHGAPLERGGSWLELLLGREPVQRAVRAPGKLRSAGVTDLRFGNVLDEHWARPRPLRAAGDARRGFPLPAGVACYAIAGDHRTAPGRALPGDGLVPVDSALGRHRSPSSPGVSRSRISGSGVPGMSHLDLLHRAEVYAMLRGWLD